MLRRKKNTKKCSNIELGKTLCKLEIIKNQKKVEKE